MSLVNVRNVGTRPYTLPHAVHGDVVLHPGQERVCHLEVALVNLGNPAAVNRGPAQADRLRDAEVKRIQTIWGFYAGLHSDAAWDDVGIDGLSGHPIGPFRPDIEVYDLDGNRMWMIHDDPAGEHRSELVADRIADVSSGRAVEKELSALQEQVRQLTDILTAYKLSEKGSEPPVEFEPGSDAAKIAAALDTDDQVERNQQRFDIPKPPPDAPPAGKDKPRTSRSGSRVAAG